MGNASALALYYRNTLADSGSNKGRFKQAEFSQNYSGCTEEIVKKGLFPKDAVESLFSGTKSKSLVVELRPWVAFRAKRHGLAIADGLPEVISLVCFHANLFPDGQLRPIGDNGNAVVTRDLLHPLAPNLQSIAVGTVEDFDHFLGSTPFEPEDASSSEALWEAYVSYVRAMAKEVAGDWHSQFEEYDVTGRWYYRVLDSEPLKNNPAAAVVDLYDALILQGKDGGYPSLFERFASAINEQPVKKLVANVETLSMRLGHSGDAFPLAKAQRDALSQIVSAEDGDLLAVNGPPGTGKTTLLLDVISSKWVKAAVDGGMPPVIFACSTNNQAITNIIDAFAKDFGDGADSSDPFVKSLCGRWLPDVFSYGTYCPSASLSRSKPELHSLYHTEKFHQEIESKSYLIRAKEYYLSSAKSFLGTEEALDLKTVTSLIHDEIIQRFEWLKNLENRLQVLEHAYQELAGIESTLLAGSERESVDETLHQELERLLAETDKERERIQALRATWKTYQPKTTFLSRLGISSQRQKESVRKQIREDFAEMAEANKVLFPNTDLMGSEQQDSDFYLQLIDKRQNEFAQKEEDIRNQLKQCEQFFAIQRRIQSLFLDLGSFSNVSEADYRESFESFIDKIDAAIETQHRFVLFRLATHYWEGRWLQEMESLGSDLQSEKKKKGAKAVTARWRRRMMITPCAVATFFALPNLMTCTAFNGGDFSKDYLYQFLDLLIADEGGMVVPEIAAASFALAKQGLVIGDTQQIEPIWSVVGGIDVGNACESGLVTAYGAEEHYERLKESGLLASNGSLMRVAQRASRMQYDADLAGGLWLYEHRRCHDPIIDYCNRLCYSGKLIPRKGNGAGIDLGEKGVIAPVAYAHINGFCEVYRGSRANKIEAQAIVNWITDNQQAMCDVYDQSLDKILAIVTPFAGQVKYISQLLSKAGISTFGDGGLTVGTTHALQGAERPIVIFSGVYSSNANGGFIDASPSMMNVAVSRAKDAFIYFGDLDAMAIAGMDTPRSILLDDFRQNPSAELLVEQLARTDLQKNEDSPVRILTDADEHDEFLFSEIENAKSEIIIVSPWLSEPVIYESGIVEALAKAKQRGVSVRVYTDDELNIRRLKPEKYSALLRQLEEIEVSVFELAKIHSKFVIFDKSKIGVGSFNWLSAARQGLYRRNEHTMVYSGPSVRDEAEKLTKVLLG